MESRVVGLFVLSIGLCSAQSSRLAKCDIRERMPVSGANEGGYRFVYQSSLGTLGAFYCRTFWIANTPGGVMTPVLWQAAKHAGEVFVETTLPACPPASPDCAGVLRPGTATVKKPTANASHISYGVNHDEYSVTNAPAYKQVAEQPQPPSKYAPLVTGFNGTVADADGKPVRLNFEVASFLEGNGPYSLSYEMTVFRPSIGLDILPRERIPSVTKFPVLVWTAAESERFYAEIQKRELRLDSPPKAVVVKMNADSFQIDDEGVLSILFNGKTILRTTAPAYKPK